MASATIIPTGTSGCDTSLKLNGKQIDTLANTPLPSGETIKFIFRYVSRGLPSAYDIDATEAMLINAAGLILCLVQYGPPKNPWPVDAAHGTSHGQAAARNASTVGYPSGCHIFLDMEGLAPSGQVVLNYVQAWCDAVHAAGYKAGVYVGFASGLTFDQWGHLDCIDLFWCDAAPRVPPTGKGFGVKQSMTITLKGVPIDPDKVSADQLGRLLIGMGPDVNISLADPDNEQVKAA